MPAVNPANFPLINGVEYSWSSAYINILGVNYQGIKSISYRHSLEPTELRGTRAQAYARTRGKYTAEGSIEIYRGAFEDIATAIHALGLGLLEASFLITTQYQEGLSAPVTDTLVGVRMKNMDFSGSEDGEALVVKADLHMMYLLVNGRAPFSVPNFIKGGL